VSVPTPSIIGTLRTVASDARQAFQCPSVSPCTDRPAFRTATNPTSRRGQDADLPSPSKPAARQRDRQGCRRTSVSRAFPTRNGHCEADMGRRQPASQARTSWRRSPGRRTAGDFQVAPAGARASWPARETKHAANPFRKGRPASNLPAHAIGSPDASGPAGRETGAGPTLQLPAIPARSPLPVSRSPRNVSRGAAAAKLLTRSADGSASPASGHQRR
jgi:hypothetical protein